MSSPILSVANLTTSFRVDRAWHAVVRGVSFDIFPNETVAVVGESGSGKSVTALSIMQLTPPGSCKIEGSIKLAGSELLGLRDADMRQIRGNEIAMIFQEPMTALNPVLTVGQQIVETVLLHQAMTRTQARERAIEMLRLVHISEPQRQVDSYPHQLSGGMRQRAMIAMALSCNPKLLIADEPTTALDVTIQAQILELMQELQALLGTSIIMITHDLGVIAETATRVAVMYAGRKVEEADVMDLFDHPRHPYTQGLLRAIPGMDLDADDVGARRRLFSIEGTVPPLTGMPAGCAFAPRCTAATDICRRETPLLDEKAPRHWAACWNSAPGAAA